MSARSLDFQVFICEPRDEVAPKATGSPTQIIVIAVIPLVAIDFAFAFADRRHGT